MDIYNKAQQDGENQLPFNDQTLEQAVINLDQLSDAQAYAVQHLIKIGRIIIDESGQPIVLLHQGNLISGGHELRALYLTALGYFGPQCEPWESLKKDDIENHILSLRRMLNFRDPEETLPPPWIAPKKA